MKKKWFLLLLMLLTSCKPGHSEESISTSFSCSETLGSNSGAPSNIESSFSSEVPISTETPSTISSEVVTPSSESDSLSHLKGDAKKVATKLRDYEEVTIDAYALLRFTFTLTYTIEYRFAYYFNEDVFQIYTKIRETDRAEDLFYIGYVYFYWGDFQNGIFGGHYEYANEYIINNIEFTHLTFGNGPQHLDWREVIYETNFPEHEVADYSKMMQRFELVFSTLRFGVEYVSDYLTNNFSPAIKLY